MKNAKDTIEIIGPIAIAVVVIGYFLGINWF
jgi:hypothetical protein